MQLAIVFACLYYAYLVHTTNRPSIKHWGLLILSAFLCLFSHIQVLPLLLILNLYDYINHRNYKASILNTMIILALFGSKIYLLPAGYEKEQISTIEVIITKFLEIDFLSLILKIASTAHFLPLHLFATGTCLLLLLKKESITAFAVATSYLSYILFIIIMTPVDGPVVLEKHFMPLSIIIAIPLFQSLDKYYSSKTSLQTICLLLAFSCFSFSLISAGDEHSKRLKYHQTLLTRLPYKGKFYIDRNLMPQKTIKGLWGFGVESLLLSYLNGSSSNTVLHLKSATPLPPNNKKTFLLTNKEHTISTSSLNKKRFIIDSTRVQVDIPISCYPNITDWQ